MRNAVYRRANYSRAAGLVIVMVVEEEQGMSFTDIVQNKIKERHTGPSPKALAQAARDKRFRLLATQVIDALEAMRDRLFEDPLFADVIGRPELEVEPWNEEGEDGATLTLEGRLARFSVVAGEHAKLWGLFRVG